MIEPVLSNIQLIDIAKIDCNIEFSTDDINEDSQQELLISFGRAVDKAVLAKLTEKNTAKSVFPVRPWSKEREMREGWARAMSEKPTETTCFCDANNLGERGVTCGDCPRDYKPKPPPDALREAAQSVVRSALDSVDVHPCDKRNDEIAAAGLTTEMRCLYDALREALK